MEIKSSFAESVITSLDYPYQWKNMAKLLDPCKYSEFQRKAA